MYSRSHSVYLSQAFSGKALAQGISSGFLIPEELSVYMETINLKCHLNVHPNDDEVDLI